MKFGNLNEVFDNEKTIYEKIDDINKEHMLLESQKKQGKFSKLLTTLSRYGMTYTDQVLKNMQAVPADRNLQNKEDIGYHQSLYQGWDNSWTPKKEEDKSYSEKALIEKVRVLRKMATQPELEDILDILANECIVYDNDESYIATPFMDTALIQELNEKSAEEIRRCVDTSFYKLYMLLDFKRNAWSLFKRWLIDGVLAFEIVYDDLEHPKSIIGIIPIDPTIITRKVDQDGTEKWIMFKDMVGLERTLLSSQIIYVKYSERDDGVDRQSYLERLIRPFNIYRIIEQAQIIWTTTQASFKMMFTIPVAGMNKARGLQTLQSAMNRYKEEITFNSETGELLTNGKVNQIFNKEYWMPENENGKPEIETLVDNGPQLNDSDQLTYHLNKLYKISKIPLGRFDKDAQATWFGSDPTAVLRDEINFGRFVNRLRATWSEIILKPLRIQVSLSIPDIKNDKRILDAISLRFNTYNQFTEMMEIEIDTKRVEFIQTMHDSLTTQDDEGNDVSFFSQKFLVLKYLKMSEADLELNEKYLLEEKFKKKSGNEEEDEDTAGADEEENAPEDDMGNEDEGSAEDEKDNDLDSEMLGDVQPESSETTEK